MTQLRLVHDNNSKLSAKVYHKTVVSRLKWQSDIKSWLDKLNLTAYWTQQSVPHITAFKTEVRNALHRTQREDYFSSCTSSKTLFQEMLLSPTPGDIAPYLKEVYEQDVYQSIARLKLRSHRLAIESDSWKRPKILYWRRRCPCCLVLEDEEHFLFNCDLYNHLPA